MQAAVYTRISQDSTGERAGVQRQRDDCYKLAKSLGWKVVTEFDDNDLSAFSGKARPGFEALLDGMKRGDFGALICWHPDRLYRSMKDLERLIEVADAGRVQIRTVNGGDLDLSNSSGRMLARILGSVSRQESEHKGERQRRANEQAAAAGKWVSANRPFGYTQDGEVVDPEAAAIRKAAADVLAGKSIRQVAREWNEAGIVGSRGRPFTSPNVRRLLVNPRYAAINVYRGKVVGPGAWEAILDADTHRGLVAFLSDPSRVVNTAWEKKHMGVGVYRCGVCDGPMRHAYAGNPRVRRYECKAAQHVTRRGEPLDEYVTALVLGRLAEHSGVVVGEDRKVDVATLHTQRTALQARLDELASMFAEGVIDGSQLRRGTGELRAQLAEVDGQLADLARRSPVAGLLNAGDRLGERWAELSADLKGKVVDELMVVRVLPAPRGRQGFSPEHISIEWRA